MRSWRCLDCWAQVHKQPGHLGERRAGSRTAAPAPGDVTRPSQSSSNYVSDTHSHKQAPDTSCLFLDWKSLFLPTQVVRLEHAEHQQSQQHHVQLSLKGQCQQASKHFLVISLHFHGGKGWEIFWIAAEGTMRSSPDTLAQGVHSPSVPCLLWWPALSSLLSSSVLMFSNTHPET